MATILLPQTVKRQYFTVFLLLAICLPTHAKSSWQGKITLSEKATALEKVFKDITTQSGYYFWSPSDMPELKKKIDVDVKDATIQEALTACLKGLGLTYTIADKMVFVKKGEAPPAEPEKHEQGGDPVDVNGRVVNEQGDPVPGATIIVQRSKVVISANDKGEFSLKGLDAHDTLVISSIGFETRTITLATHKGFLNLELKNKVGILDETMVIGYGTTTQRYSVGSVTKVTSADIEMQPVMNPLQALEGRVPGMIVTPSSGIPGAAYTVQIRGQNSLRNFNTSNVNILTQPYFIVDGVPFASQNNNIDQVPYVGSSSSGAQLNNPQGGLSPFNSIDPAEIESIEILKDADATSIYGSRGANGVILITTKKGKAGDPKFNISVTTGATQADRLMPMMNTRQYLDMRYAAFISDSAQSDYIPANAIYIPDLLIWDTTRYTNWSKVFLSGTAQTTQVNASLSGGTNTMQFRVGAGYQRTGTMFPGDYSTNRTSFDMNLHYNSVNKRLNVDFSTLSSYAVTDLPGSPSILTAFTLEPDFPSLLDAQGNLVWTYKGINFQTLGVNNPYVYTKISYSSKAFYLANSVQLSYLLVAGLSFKANVGYNVLNNNEVREQPAASQNPINQIATANFGTNTTVGYIIEPQLEYKRTFGRSKLDVLIGATESLTDNMQTNIFATGYPDDNLLGSAAAASSVTALNANAEDKYNAGFGRINYILNSRYVLDLTGRRDGSSRFGPGKQFGDFGSVAGGWIFSETQFMKEAIPLISFGKLRISYGTAGSDNVGDYQYQANWGVSQFGYQNQKGFTPLNLPNPNYSWDNKKSLDAGFDVGLLKDRFVLTVSLYRTRCGDQLIGATLPSQTGFQTVTENFPANIQNTGWEVAINTINVRKKDFRWTTSFNISGNANKLIAFPGLSTSPYNEIYTIGRSVNYLPLLKSTGVNDTTGGYQYVTAKGGPQYAPVIQSQKDFTASVTLQPGFTGGLGNTLTYKSFSLSFFFYFKKQKGYSALYSLYQNQFPGSEVNQPTFVESRWKKLGDKSSIEAATTGWTNTPAYQASFDVSQSTLAYSDASFAKLQNVSLSYRLPVGTLRRWSVSGCSINLRVENLLTITGYKGPDPETQQDFGIPPLRVLVASLQLTF